MMKHHRIPALGLNYWACLLGIKDFLYIC